MICLSNFTPEAKTVNPNPKLKEINTNQMSQSSVLQFLASYLRNLASNSRLS